VTNDIITIPQTIELDCPPGDPRPSDLIDAVLEGTGLVPIGEPSKCFGNFEYSFDISREEWVERIQPIIKPRIEALYNSGIIRYGSW
jgi:hypothetical protein